MKLPLMFEVKQKINQPKIDDYVLEVRSELRKKNLDSKIKPGSKIAITAGSRGISNIPKILATVVDEVKKSGGEPFLIPAMGSHGGATPQGQVETLKSLGITPETVDAPILSSMEVDEVGEIEGTPIYVDRNALRADGIIVVGRIKPHTDFKGEIESGLMKMMAIGLGKQKGAEMIHWHLYEGYHKLLPAAARLIMERTKILLGLAILENAQLDTAVIKALEPHEIEAQEKKLLEKAKDLLPRLPFKEIDVLVVEEIGKNISGVGMDTNVTGRFWIPGESDPRASKIKKIAVLDLSEESLGNAIGIGLADFTTRRFVEKIDYPDTFINCLTQGTSATGKIPIFLPNDRDAIITAVRTCGPIDSQESKIVRIKNTLELERMWISERLAQEIRNKPQLYKHLEFIDEPREIKFDILGNLVR